jgi:hypothetical protein
MATALGIILMVLFSRLTYKLPIPGIISLLVCLGEMG